MKFILPLIALSLAACGGGDDSDSNTLTIAPIDRDAAVHADTGAPAPVPDARYGFKDHKASVGHQRH